MDRGCFRAMSPPRIVHFKDFSRRGVAELRMGRAPPDAGGDGPLQRQ